MQKTLILGLIVGLAILLAGCNAPVTDTDTLTLVFDNQANEPVDPHFSRSGSNLSADQLFDNSSNSYQNFNGETTIPAKTKIEIQLPSTQAITIGSNQAEFGSIATWTGGISQESPILRQPEDFDASQKITFTFTKDIGGIYHTTVTISNN
ncbi:MAG: hypothetical protein WC975_12525 [Phycisphaerae bacterium]